MASTTASTDQFSPAFGTISPAPQGAGPMVQSGGS
jgi:hypothetical protein